MQAIFDANTTNNSEGVMGQVIELFKQDPLNRKHRGKFYFAKNFMDATLRAKRKGIPLFNIVWLDKPQYIDDMQVAPQSSVTIFIPYGRNDLAALAMNMDFIDGEEHDKNTACK